MQHSPITISDLLNEIVDRHKEIEDTILIGEKITMIHEASYPYNQLRTLVTNDYLLPDELAVLTSIGSSWRDDIAQYDKAMGHNQEQQVNLDELEEQIREALNELFDQGDYDSLGGGDCEPIE